MHTGDKDRFVLLVTKQRIGIATEAELGELATMLCNPEYARIYAHIQDYKGYQTYYERYKSMIATPMARKPWYRRYWWAAAALLFLTIATGAIALFILRPEPEIYAKSLEATLVTSQGSSEQLVLTATQSTWSVDTLSYTHNHAATPEQYQLSTGLHNEFRVTLSDGTVIHMDYDSEIRFPKHFGSTQRRVYLRGEAFFTIAADKRPFVVQTDQGEVRQLGTLFNLRAVPGERNSVVLVRGSVSVTPKESHDATVTLTPGQQATFGAVGSVSVAEVDVSPYLAWDQGQFSFDNMPLKSIMAVVQRWYGVKVLYEDAEVAQVRFTGVLDRTSSLNHLLNAIANVANVRIVMKERVITISHKS